MNERIQRLREISMEAAPSITAERALLLTDFYSDDASKEHSVPVQRALAFRHYLLNKKIHIEDGELIVGERGPAPKATPTYPEICLHSLDDLDLLNSREKLPYLVDSETRRAFEETLIPFWSGSTQRERIISSMTEDWLAAYSAGVFTEFQEQRSPGHTVLGDVIYRMGLNGVIAEIDHRLNELDEASAAQRDQLTAMKITAEVVIEYARRHADLLEDMAVRETDQIRAAELMKMADICNRAPGNAPRTYWEALQAYWFVHIGVICELNPWDSFNPGRLDQHLLPYFAEEIASGELSEESARELLQAFWIKFNNQPAPPKVGVTAQESNTYTDFALINVGGVDRDGNDAVNPVTMLILDVIEELRLLQPSSMVQVSRENSDDHLRRAMEILKTGFGQPSIFNTDAIVAELVRHGKTVEHAREGGASGCVEAGAFGRECYILTGYFNLPKILEITLNNGIDLRSGKRIGIETGDPLSFTGFDQLFRAFARQMKHFVDIKITGNLIIDELFASHVPAPFLSCLIEGCVEKGRDYHDGGALYNTSYIQGVGLGTITDCLTAIRYNVFDEQRCGMKQMLEAIKADFAGHEQLQNKLINETPKYGNDNDYADEIMTRVFEEYFLAVDGRSAGRGGKHRVNMLPTTCHVYFGSVIDALPDGRKAGMPVSEGISPVQGADRRGPTSVLKSAAKLDHLRTGGTLLNQKLTPDLLASDEGMDAAVNLVRTYFSMNGHHIQFNVVKAETLREAQRQPEKHRDLIVRVAGYSDYFVDLTKPLQDEIIRRTEHMA